MKKKILIVLLIIVCLILFLYICSFKKITYIADRSMLFVVMPSPPHAKIITDSDEILCIIDLLNCSNKIGSGVVVGIQSWIGQIRYNGQIYYISKCCSIVNNGIEYKIDGEVITKLFEEYEKSSALEENFSETVIENFKGGRL